MLEFIQLLESGPHLGTDPGFCGLFAPKTLTNMEMGHHLLLLYFVSLSAGVCRKPQNCSVVGPGKISTTEKNPDRWAVCSALKPF